MLKFSLCSGDYLSLNTMSPLLSLTNNPSVNGIMVPSPMFPASFEAQCTLWLYSVFWDVMKVITQVILCLLGCNESTTSRSLPSSSLHPSLLCITFKTATNSDHIASYIHDTNVFSYCSRVLWAPWSEIIRWKLYWGRPSYKIEQATAIMVFARAAERADNIKSTTTTKSEILVKFQNKTQLLPSEYLTSSGLLNI